MGNCSSRSGVRNKQDSMVPPQSQNSKLGEPQRRRLSVSAVEGDAALQDILIAKNQTGESASEGNDHDEEEEDDDDGSGGGPVSLDDVKRIDSVPRRQRRGTDLHGLSERAVICKLDNAVERLQHGSAVRDVTLKMISDLLKASRRSYLVFGDPADGQQRGFDHKKLATCGTLATPDVDLQRWNVGFACKKGFKPESPNQDDFFVAIVDDWKLVGVFDGHGPFGHDVSSFVHRTLPYLLLSDRQWEQDPAETFKRNFVQVHKLLEAYSQEGNLDCSLSGTTGTVLLIRDGVVHAAHVGDSRAVLATKRGGKIVASDITDDHKPTLPEERQRIEEQGGEVRRLEGDIPHRVFIRGRLYPGLAMSRAIGDSVGAVVGVSCEPDVSARTLKTEDEFLIVASDGVWEFITSQEAVDLVSSRIAKEGLQKATSFLAYEAWRRWVQEEENVVDDVTCVVVKLH